MHQQYRHELVEDRNSSKSIQSHACSCAATKKSVQIRAYSSEHLNIFFFFYDVVLSCKVYKYFHETFHLTTELGIFAIPFNRTKFTAIYSWDLSLD